MISYCLKCRKEIIKEQEANRLLSCLVTLILSKLPTASDILF